MGGPPNSLLGPFLPSLLPGSVPRGVADARTSFSLAQLSLFLRFLWFLGKPELAALLGIITYWAGNRLPPKRRVGDTSEGGGQHLAGSSWPAPSKSWLLPPLTASSPWDLGQVSSLPGFHRPGSGWGTCSPSSKAAMPKGEPRLWSVWPDTGSPSCS